jgi:hypothetical protein
LHRRSGCNEQDITSAGEKKQEIPEAGAVPLFGRVQAACLMLWFLDELNPARNPHKAEMMRWRSIFCLSLAATGGAMADEGPTWRDVEPIFVERCVMCHSSQGASKGLRLDTLDGAIAGSADGAVLIPGNADASELVLRLRGESLPRMPFLSYPLSTDQIALIIQWIDAGMPDDE